MIAINSLRNIININDELVLCNDYEKTNSYNKDIGFSFSNGILFTIPNNKFIKKVIDHCVYNIHNNKYIYLNEADKGYCNSILDITGPTMLYKILKNKNISLKDISVKDISLYDEYIKNECIKLKHNI
jgi:hypothetical protein